MNDPSDLEVTSTSTEASRLSHAEKRKIRDEQNAVLTQLSTTTTNALASFSKELPAFLTRAIEASYQKQTELIDNHRAKIEEIEKTHAATLAAERQAHATAISERENKLREQEHLLLEKERAHTTKLHEQELELQTKLRDELATAQTATAKLRTRSLWILAATIPATMILTFAASWLLISAVPSKMLPDLIQNRGTELAELESKIQTARTHLVQLENQRTALEQQASKLTQREAAITAREADFKKTIAAIQAEPIWVAVETYGQVIDGKTYVRIPPDPQTIERDGQKFILLPNLKK